MSISITECMPVAAACPAGSRPRRRLAVAVAALLGVALLLAGCGSDDGTPASEARQDGKTSASGEGCGGCGLWGGGGGQGADS